MWVELIGNETIAVIPAEAIIGSDPDISFVIDDHAVDPVGWQALFHGEMLEGEAGRLCPEGGGGRGSGLCQEHSRGQEGDGAQEDGGEKAGIKQKAGHIVGLK